MTETPKVSPQDPTHSIARMLSELREIHIETDWDTEIRAMLDRLLMRDDAGSPLNCPVRFAHGQETRGVLVVHEPGGCKTTLVAHLLSAHPALAGGQASLCAPVRSPASLRGLMRDLLHKSGYSIVDDQEDAWELAEQLKRRLAIQGRSVIWLDEAHDLGAVGHQNMLKTIKSFMQGNSPVIVILSGTPELLRIVRTDEQLNRRFLKLVLPLLDEVDDIDKIWSVLGVYCDRIGLLYDLGPDFPGRLMHSSRYLFGRCVEAIIGAIELALLEEADSLTLNHFADQFSAQEGCSWRNNIFLSPDWRQIDPANPEGLPVDLPRSDQRRRRR